MRTDPVEVEATINGAVYRLIEKSAATVRSVALRSGSAGVGWALFSRHRTAGVLTFANNAQRTAQQLMADVLLDNGIPMGWTVDWHLTDWLACRCSTPAAHLSMDRLLAVASGRQAATRAAALTSRSSSACCTATLSRRGTGDTVTPDFELPAASQRARHRLSQQAGIQPGVRQQHWLV